MRNLVSILKQTRFFLLPQLVFTIAAGTVLLLNKKEEIHIAINHFFGAFGDAVMPWVTLAGDGWTITVLVLLLFALDRRFAFFTGISCLLASTITQTLKLTLFYGDPRPAFLFRNHEIRFVPGIENHFYDSFPSGHTTVAFAFFFCIALLVKNNWLRLACFVVALLIGYSRIYLSQHFLGDVFGGSLIGSGTAILVMAVAERMQWLRKKSPKSEIRSPKS